MDTQKTEVALVKATNEINPMMERFKANFPSSEIVNDEGMTTAATILDEGRKWLKVQDDERKELVGPLNAHVKWINARYGAVTKPVSDVIDMASGMMSARQEVLDAAVEVENRRRIAEEAKKTAEGTSTSPIPESIAPVVPATPNKVYTQTGNVSFRESWVIEVLDIKQLPKTLKVAGQDFVLVKPDQPILNKLVSLGVRELKGCQIRKVKTPVRGK